MFKLLSYKEKLQRAERSLRRIASLQNNSDVALSIAFVTMAEGGSIDDVTASEHVDMFAPWVCGASYSVGALRGYNGALYRCAQAHTSQYDWTPDTTPALWVKVGDPTVEYPAWSQPIGAHDAYAPGDKVSHNNKKWTSVVEGNVWEPGVFGWNEVT